MNFPRANKFWKWLGKKEKEEDVGLEEVTSDQGPSSSIGAVCLPVDDDLSTPVQRRGRQGRAGDEENILGEVIIPQHPRASSSSTSIFTVATEVLPTITTGKKRESIESESSSSQSSSIEEALRRAIGSVDSDEFTDSFAKRSNTHDSKKSNQEKRDEPQGKAAFNQEKPEEQQQDQQHNEEVAEQSAQDGADGESGGYELENLQNPAASSSSKRPDHTGVNLDGGADEESVQQKNPTYVESYLGVMYKFGLSPFLPEGASPGIWGYCQIACLIQVVIYWIFTISSILESLAYAKYQCVEFVAIKGDLEDFTNMCYYIMDVCTHIYSGYLFGIQQQKFAKMLKSYGRLRDFAERYSKVKEEKNHTYLVYALAAMSFVMSTLSIIFTTGFIGWTLEDPLLLYTVQASTLPYIWTEEGYNNNSTGLVALYKQYGQNPATGKMIVGFIYGAMKLCSRVLANANSDLILMTGATIKKEMFRLANEVSNPDHDINPVTMENFEAPGGQWEHYKLLEEAVDDTNDTFDSLLKYLHVENVMLFVYLVMNAFDGELSVVTILYYIYNTVKASCTYRIATQASEKNQTFRDWIRRLIWKSPDPEFRSKAKTIVDRMKEHPLGLGQGQFMIDEGFLFRFLGTVGSVFVLQAQTRQDPNTCGTTKRR